MTNTKAKCPIARVELQCLRVEGFSPRQVFVVGMPIGSVWNRYHLVVVLVLVVAAAVVVTSVIERTPRDKETLSTIHYRTVSAVERWICLQVLVFHLLHVLLLVLQLILRLEWLVFVLGSNIASKV